MKTSHEPKSDFATDAWGTTPGPWVADVHCATRYGARFYVPVLRPGNDPVPVAAVHLDVDGYGRDEGRANASAIAQLPAMIAFIEDVIRDADAGQTVGQVREAEARAIKRRVVE